MKQGDPSALAPHPLLMLPGLGAVAFAAIFLISGMYFGAARDLGAFLISGPTLGLTFFCALVIIVWTTRIRAQRKHALVACLLVMLTVPAYLKSYGMYQRLRFLIWSQTHHDQLAKASKRNGIITHWDGWGMAGQDTDSYLVVDNEDKLRSESRAEQWTKEIGQTCGIWQAQRMRPRIYVVTTYTNCPYDGV